MVVVLGVWSTLCVRYIVCSKASGCLTACLVHKADSGCLKNVHYSNGLAMPPPNPDHSLYIYNHETLQEAGGSGEDS